MIYGLSQIFYILFKNNESKDKDYCTWDQEFTDKKKKNHLACRCFTFESMRALGLEDVTLEMEIEKHSENNDIFFYS